MSASLSHDLPPLRAAGNVLLRADTGEEVRLRGLNRSGLEYSAPRRSGFLEAARLSREEIEEITTRWGANIIRLPFNQDWALNGSRTHTADDYLAALDQVVEWAAAFGAYTLLDLQWLDAHTEYGTLADGSINRVPPLPNGRSVDLWRMLASRYRHEPAVLFDLFNEPHSRLFDDPNPLWLVGLDGEPIPSDQYDVTAAEWLPWARKLAATIRAIHPEALLWISGIDWGNDLREIVLDSPGIVYSAHVYPNRPRRQWVNRFGHRRDSAPLFVSEWGGEDADLEWGRHLLRFLEFNTCGWTAWSWADRPRLVADARLGDYTPTAFGGLVRSGLQNQEAVIARRSWLPRFLTGA